MVDPTWGETAGFGALMGFGFFVIGILFGERGVRRKYRLKYERALEFIGVQDIGPGSIPTVKLKDSKGSEPHLRTAKGGDSACATCEHFYQDDDDYTGGACNRHNLNCTFHDWTCNTHSDYDND